MFATLVALLTSVPIMPTPLLVNGDFETGDSQGWGGFWGRTYEVTSAAAQNGLGAHISIDPATADISQGGLYQDVSGIAPGQRVSAEVWYAVPAGDPLTGDTELQLVLEFLDGQGLGAENPPTRVVASAAHQPAAGVWTHDFLSVDVPAGTATVRYTLLLTRPAGGSGGGGVYLDDLSLSEVAPSCGDRVVDAPGERCDTGELLSDTTKGACKTDCSGLVGQKGADDSGCAGAGAAPLGLAGAALARLALARRRRRAAVAGAMAAALALGACGSPKPQPAADASPVSVSDGAAPSPDATPSADAQAQAPGAPTQVTTVEGITEWRFDNGLRVLLFPDPSQTTATVNITYEVGSRHEGYGETGMAHLLEHMMFKGTPGHPTIWNEFQQKGAQFNGTTDYDRTNYYETFTASDENLAWALELEADRMVHSKIAAEDLSHEFSVVRNEFEQDENDSASILHERMLSTAYLWHNYGKSPIGSRSDIERVPVDNLRRFYEEFYQPDNAVLVVAGKIDPAKTLDLVAKHFAAIPKPERQLPTSYTDEPVQDGERSVTLRRVGETQVIGVLYHTVAGADDAFVATEAIGHVLTNEPSGRLYTALVATGMASRVWSHAQPLAEPGTLALFAEVAGDKPIEPVRDALIATVEGLGQAEHAPTDAEIQRFQASFAKDFDLMMNDSQRVAIELTDWQAQGDWRLLFTHRDRVAKLDAAQTTAVAAAYLKAENRTLGMFIPTKEPQRAPAAGRPDVAKLVEGYQGKAAVASGEAFEATVANIEAHTTRKTIGGVQLALLPKATRGGQVKARLVLHYGSEAELTPRMTAAEMLPDMLMRGTAKHSYQQIKDELDKLKARVSFQPDGVVPRPGTLAARIETTKENLQPVLALLGELLAESTFPDDQFAAAKAETLTSLQEAQSNPQALAITAAIRKLLPYPAESIHYVPTIAEEITRLQALTVADVKGFYHDLLGASNAEMSVVGDFDPAVVEGFVSDKLAPWKSPRPFERVVMPFKPSETGAEVIDTPDKEGGFIIALEALELKDDDADYPALQLFDYVLGGGASSRLIERLRQKEGWSYGAFSQLKGGALDAFGLIIAGALVNPQNSDKALAALIEETNQLLEKGVADDELAKVKVAWKNAYDSQLADDDWIAEKLVAGLFTQRTLAWEQTFNESVLALTSADIAKALAKGRVSTKAFATIIAADQKKAKAPPTK
ncbi:MAG: insulinase family protein [Myxococcota bacterium]